MARMQPVKRPRTVPVVLSMQEAAALIAAARNVKHQAARSAAYGAGLRASEVCRLKVGDVDSQRMAPRVEQGKGAKDRYAMLNPVVLAHLRAWWRVGRAQGRMLPGGWLFPGMNPMEPLSARQLSRAVHDAASAAGITKRVTTHTQRHSVARHHKTMTLSPQEFMRRFLMHVLPGGLHRIRHYGLLANGSRRADLARVCEALQVETKPTAVDAEPAATPVGSPTPAFVCRHCGRALPLVQTLQRAELIRGPPAS